MVILCAVLDYFKPAITLGSLAELRKAFVTVKFTDSIPDSLDILIWWL